MIYTVFPVDSMPQDFSTYDEAFNYGLSLDEEFVIESTEGEVV